MNVEFITFQLIVNHVEYSTQVKEVKGKANSQIVRSSYEDVKLLSRKRGG